MNVKTGNTIVSRMKKTYDEITILVSKMRNRNKYLSIIAEEMDRSGKNVLDDGRMVALDSLFDEELFASSLNDYSNEYSEEENY